MKRHILTIGVLSAALAACTTNVTQEGTLAELERVPADLNEVHLEDSLERAAQSYRRYLQETPESARTPEAMRRLADLQIEQAYGVIGDGNVVEMAAPESGAQSSAITAGGGVAVSPRKPSESDLEFERRALSREQFLEKATDYEAELLDADG